ncbi:hypothetical protein ONS96_001771 [Cadophora gregata f. sp. sojae]|nr:hypothetical protein ONS96_001771 [Cadophora gregata f. sp. sojae]
MKEDAALTVFIAMVARSESTEAVLERRHVAMEKLAKRLFPFWFWYQHIISRINVQVDSLEYLLAFKENTLNQRIRKARGLEKVQDYFRRLLSSVKMLEKGQNARVNAVLCACELAKNKVKSGPEPDSS